MSASGIPEKLPYDLDTEKCVLGSVLRDPRCFPEVDGVVSADDFYVPRHREIYLLMEGLERRNPGHCDAVSVAHEQERLNQTEALGGPGYLKELMTTVPSIAFLENHIRIVRDLALRRGLISAADTIQRSVYDDSVDDVNVLVSDAEKTVFQVGDRLVGKDMISARELVDRNLEMLLNADGSPQGLQTGYMDLDEKQGFRAGDLIVLAARPGMGKTAFALNILERVAVKEKKSVLMFSLEMPGDQLMTRLLSSHARISHHNLRQGKLTQEDRRRLTHAGGALRNARVFVDDSSQPSLAQIRAKARRLKRDGALDLVIIDYLQLLGAKAESRQNEISLISRTLKSIARDMKVPVLALAQLNRKAEERSDHKPMLSDLRESGAIEQDADMVMLLMREDYYEETEDNRDKANVSIAKNRHGATGDFPLRFTKKYMRFENYIQESAGMSMPSAPAFD
ncbi:MAG: replicative DNA helicase [Planctomycetota bacterium]|jgi:replicative DNA helicase|nr:replicative DNA helicase [Planctomycetota bacterium]